MAIEKIGMRRSKIEYLGDRIQITIPSRKNWLSIILQTFWLGGWLFGEIMVPAFLFVGPILSLEKLFMLLWLAIWTIGGGYVIYNIFWSLVGKEIITFSYDRLKIEKKIFQINFVKVYSMMDASDFRISTSSPSNAWYYRNYPPYLTGLISFDYGMKTIKFATEIDEAEAKYLLEEMQKNGFISA
ncbi:hypothetical protein [Leptospira neocaledonica]|uniref:Uncharacterized protein n=1 Tax=Leptospira neocaledonica TaxID=2023192 RepID=A0A2M9ZTK8_9LEPT|nr:hypothetical protein [Leptospira neocaledonica]PJZ75311.1 hypothetical protein CH365_19505 [Leptospira neocaledonica]